jgi:hypothetical protein
MHGPQRRTRRGPQPRAERSTVRRTVTEKRDGPAEAGPSSNVLPFCQACSQPVATVIPGCRPELSKLSLGPTQLGSAGSNRNEPVPASPSSQ